MARKGDKVEITNLVIEPKPEKKTVKKPEAKEPETAKSGFNFEDLINSTVDQNNDSESLSEAMFRVVSRIFNPIDKRQNSRLIMRNVRGIIKGISYQSYLRTCLDDEYVPFVDESGNFTEGEHDNRVLTAVMESCLATRISANGLQRKEIIELFRAITSAQQTEQTENRGWFGVRKE